MSTVAKKKEPDVGEWLANAEVRERLESALAGSIAVDEFAAQILIELQKPEYGQCTAKSKFKAIHLCAALTLLPTMQHVALIPYKDSKSRTTELKAMPQWQGFHAIMMRHPDVMDIDVRLVFQGDDFEFDGTTHTVTCHNYDPFASREVNKDLKNLRGGYLVVTFIDGRRKFHMTTVDHIRKCRGCAQTKTVWDNWTLQMCLKTIYRDAFARRSVPVDPTVSKHLRAVIDEDDRLLQNNPRLIESRKKRIAPVSIVDAVAYEESTETEEVAQDHASMFSDCRDPYEVDELLAKLTEDGDDEKIAAAANDRRKELLEKEGVKSNGELFDSSPGGTEH